MLDYAAPQHFPRASAPMNDVMERYIANINDPDPEFAATAFADSYTGEDPVGTGLLELTRQGSMFDLDLFDVPFTPKKAELIAPVRTTFANSAAMAFTFWAEVDGREITIDIIDVMTFDADGKIVHIDAHWGVNTIRLVD
ncbi:steroid delta-isomerase [Saccharopolyspora terrae]|uniref:Steroid delta-isomerase n=2 Tax=Saccharopolyspora terrae TaxID=2530384 RepID=A0A4R4VQU8_9PSEU|nr:steroid delta-isomerase [Saccharopolyspora terrae]